MTPPRPIRVSDTVCCINARTDDPDDIVTYKEGDRGEVVALHPDGDLADIRMSYGLLLRGTSLQRWAFHAAATSPVQIEQPVPAVTLAEEKARVEEARWLRGGKSLQRWAFHAAAASPVQIEQPAPAVTLAEEKARVMETEKRLLETGDPVRCVEGRIGDPYLREGVLGEIVSLHPNGEWGTIRTSGGLVVSDLRRWVLASRDVTLAEEKARVEEARWTKEGTCCRACGRYAKVYRRRLNGSMAKGLLWLAQASGDERAWVQVSSSAPRWMIATNQWTVLQHWKLVERKPKEIGKESRRTSGVWRPTELGAAFAKNAATARLYAILYNNALIDYDGPTVNIREALPKGFDYAELMQAAGPLGKP